MIIVTTRWRSPAFEPCRLYGGRGDRRGGAPADIRKPAEELDQGSFEPVYAGVGGGNNG